MSTRPVTGFRADPEVQRFADEVERFCTVIEKIDEYSVYDFVVEIDERLALLYSLAHRLPDLDHDDELIDALDAERKALSHTFSLRRLVYWDACKDAIDDKLKRARYALVFDPMKRGEPVECGFGEDIGSVYGDLKEALDVYREESEAGAQQAAWDWKFGLNHWGKHALNALAAMHSLRN